MHTYGGEAVARLAAALILLAPSRAWATTTVKPCQGIAITSPARLKLDDLETRLICGDSRQPSWAHVPKNQATYFLRNFLAARGYYHPRFTDDGGGLVVDAGAVTRVSGLETKGAPADLDVSRYWPPLDQPLTPKLLNDLEGWVKAQLAAYGFACPLVKTNGNPATGVITITIDSGPRGTVTGVGSESVHGLDPGVLRRDDAFAVGEVYDGDLVALTRQRIVGEQLVVGTSFKPTCSGDGVHLAQTATPGDPQLVIMGFGFNTERLFLLRGSYQATRLGPTGSLLTGSFVLSRPEQDVTIGGAWFPRPGRFRLEPSLTASRDLETKYETRSVTARLAPATTFDEDGIGGHLLLGPSVAVLRTTQYGGDTSISHVVALEGVATLQSHDFELNQQTPRSGFRLNVQGDASRRAAGSDFDADEIQADGEVLGNVASFDPPVLVLGWRGAAASTWPRTGNDAVLLPPTYRHFLGGGSTVRGFARQSLPPGNLGALTTVYSGFEARLAGHVPWGIQPLVFVDGGMTGANAGHVDAPIYWSPGAGVRWQSPIGAVRAVASHGEIVGDAGTKATVSRHWDFYVSFGEEF